MPVVHSSGRICYERSEIVEIHGLVSPNADKFEFAVIFPRKARKNTRSISSTHGLEDVLDGDIVKSINLRSENEDADFEPDGRHEADPSSAAGGAGGWKRVATSSGRGRSNARQRNPSFNENERPGGGGGPGAVGSFVKRTPNFQRFHTNNGSNGDGKSQPFWRQRTKSGGNIRTSVSEDQPLDSISPSAPPPGFKESPRVDVSLQETHAGEAGDEIGVNFWFYIDPENRVQGPFYSDQMSQWYDAGYLPSDLLIRRKCDATYFRLSDYYTACNGNQFVLCPPGMAPKMKLLGEPQNHLQPQEESLQEEKVVVRPTEVETARPAKPLHKVKMSAHSDIKFIINDPQIAGSIVETEQIVVPPPAPPSAGGSVSEQQSPGWAAVVCGKKVDLEEVFNESPAVVTPSTVAKQSKEKKGKKAAAAAKKPVEVVAVPAAPTVVEQKKPHQKQPEVKCELPACVNWATSESSSAVTSQSLVEIQAAQAAEEAKRQKLAAIKLKQQQLKSNSGWAAVAGAGVVQSVTPPAVVDFPDLTAVPKKTPEEKPQTTTATKKKKNGLSCPSTVDHALRDWCTKQLDNLPPINSAVDKPTLIGLLCEMQDQREVLECIETSLGKSKKVTKFSREFLQKRQLTGQS